MRLPTLLMLTASCLATSFLVPTSHSATVQGSFGVSTTGYVVAETISATTYVNAIPAGAVIAFRLTSCPTGWSEYTPARGRFLRGIDNGAGNDPSGNRAADNIQTDALQGVGQKVKFGGSSGQPDFALNNGGSSFLLSYTSTGSSNESIRTTNEYNDIGYGTPRISSETRPKNVAVLFCYKD